ncbi:MAG: YdcF family protein [Polyangiaceae bacterium]|nr:YdcF family protein [Polyangiaceae bacterium]
MSNVSQTLLYKTGTKAEVDSPLLDRISISLFFDPLLDLLIVLAVALLLIGRRRRAIPVRSKPRWGLRLAWLVWIFLWLAATPRITFGVLGIMETPPADVKSALGDTPEDRSAMIVLTGGTMSPRPQIWRAEMLAGSSLPRAVGAARVYLERPVGHVIVSGRAEPWGFPDDTAQAMADVMVAFGVPKERILIEPLAQNTRQNAVFSTMMVRALGAEKTVLVTSALHMDRAVYEHERAGLKVIAAPVDHRYEPPEGIAPYVPSVVSLQRTHQIVHELLGRYRP